jgi:hypothetical protein
MEQAIWGMLDSDQAIPDSSSRPRTYLGSWLGRDGRLPKAARSLMIGHDGSTGHDGRCSSSFFHTSYRRNSVAQAVSLVGLPTAFLASSHGLSVVAFWV